VEYIKLSKKIIFILCVCLASTNMNAQKNKFSEKLITSYRPLISWEDSQLIFEDVDNDGDPDILRTMMNGDIPVMWIDDDDDMTINDLEGDMDSDCMLIDRNKDGKYGHAKDIIIDFGDEDGDGDADIQVIIDNEDLSKTAFSYPTGTYMIVVDTDDDQVFNYINWNTVLIKAWDHNGLSHFFKDYLGQSLFLKAHTSTFNIDDVRKNWENPFLFFDADGDNLTEYTLRFTDNAPSINGIPPHPENGVIEDKDRGVQFSGFIDRADMSFDLDNDNGPGNEFDLDMTLQFKGKGFSYSDQKHVFKSLKGLEGTDEYFYDKRIRNNDVLLYPDHQNGYNLIFDRGEWDQCWFTFDEDDDCLRWERVELYEPLDLFKIGQKNGGLDNLRQSDASGDRGEWDTDNSGKGNLYVSSFDGRIHLYGAEWGAWRIDQEATYYQGYGGIYGDLYDDTNFREQMEPEKFATIKYEDTDGNSFIDKIMYDLDGDTLFEKTVLLSDLGISDECEIIITSEMDYSDFVRLHKKVAEDLWNNAQVALFVAKQYGINTDWYANLQVPNSLREKYHYGYWLNFYMHLDLINFATMKKDEELLKKVEKAYYSGDWMPLLRNDTSKNALDIKNAGVEE